MATLAEQLRARSARPGGGSRAAAWSEALSLRSLGPLFGTTVLPFLLVLYLALRGGGYDTIVRSEVGLVVWWIVLVGALAGVLPVARIGRAGWVGLAVFALLTAWTALGIGWSQSAERSVAEVGRIAAFLGVFALALAAQGRDGLPRTVGAVAAAIGIVGALALLSRLHPSWFPADETARFVSGARARLNYPLNYWNGLAAFLAMGMPLLLGVAITSRRLLAQALATAALPALALAAYFTLSRGGAVEVAVGFAFFLALCPRRLAALVVLAAAAVGAALLIAGGAQRDALESGLSSAAAATQGDEMLAMTLVVCAGVGLIRVALALAERHDVGPRLRVAPRRAAAALGVAAALALVVAIAAGLPGTLGDRWDEFKDPRTAAGTSQRFESWSGSGRYQWWQSSVDAGESDLLTGIGPGTFEYWWAEHGSAPPGFARDAHSLYLETLGELGIVGLVLVAAGVGGALVFGCVRAVRAQGERRLLLAAATAACAAFATAAALDWVWELAVLPVAFLLLAAAILRSGDDARPQGAGGGGAEARPDSTRRRNLLARGLLAAVALPAMAAIAIPMAGDAAVRGSQEAVRDSNLSSALEKARDAERIQPYAAAASLQEALVLELAGDLDGAAVAAREATRDEPTNWRNWLILSRIEAERGNASASLEHFRRARALNPSSPLFAP